MVGFLGRLLIGIVAVIISFPCEAKLQAKVLTYPIATTILTKFADTFGRKSKSKLSPLIVETVGAKSINAFCSAAENSPDVFVTHKKLALNELHPCAINGINDFVELELGHGGIVVLASPDLGLTNISALELYQAVTKMVYKDGRVVKNTVYAWSELANSGYHLPEVPIKVYLPGANAGLRDVFEDRVLVNGCQSDPEVLKLRSDVPKLYRDLCLAVRSDNAIDDMESDQQYSTASVLNKLAQEKGIVIFSSPDVLQNPDIEQYVVAVDGYKPTYESIRADAYPLSSPIYVYVKESSMVSVESLKSFLRYIYSVQNTDSSLSESAGFLPLSNQQRQQQFELVSSGWPNLRLDQADIIDKTWAMVKHADQYLPESPVEPEMPHTFVGTPLDKGRGHVDSGQGYNSQPPAIAPTIDDYLQEPGMPAEGDASGQGYDEPAHEDASGHLESAPVSSGLEDVDHTSDLDVPAQEEHEFSLNPVDPAYNFG